MTPADVKVGQVWTYGEQWHREMDVGTGGLWRVVAVRVTVGFGPDSYRGGVLLVEHRDGVIWQACTFKQFLRGHVVNMKPTVDELSEAMEIEVPK